MKIVKNKVVCGKKPPMQFECKHNQFIWDGTLPRMWCLKHKSDCKLLRGVR